MSVWRLFLPTYIMPPFFLSQVASVFLRNAAVCSHSLPQPAKERAADMMAKTREALAAAKGATRARGPLAELAALFAHYRGETEGERFGSVM